MIVMDTEMTLTRLCKAKSLWGLYLHIYNDSKLSGEEWHSNMESALPYINPIKFYTLGNTNTMCIIFDNAEEAWSAYEATGLKKYGQLNEYNGPIKVYALLINSDGEYETENC